MLEARRADHVAQRAQRVAMEVEHAIRLVRHVEQAPARRVLRRHARRAVIGVAGARLDAAQREHEAAPGVAEVGPHRQRPGDVEPAGDLARGRHAHPLAQADADQGVVHQHQRFLQRQPDMVDELGRRSAGAAFGTIDDDEVRQDAGLEHRLRDAEPFPGVADRQLEAGRLATRQHTQAIDEFQQPDRRRERRMCGRRLAVHADRNAARLRDLGRDFRAGQHAAVTGLGPLRQFEFDHPHLRIHRLGGELLRIEPPLCVAAAEIARADLPDQVASVLAVVAGDRALAGIVIEPAALGAEVQRPHGIRRERSETHRRNVEHARRIRLGALLAHRDTEVVRLGMRRHQRVVDPFVVRAVHRQLAAEGHHVADVLRALVDERALLARERHLVLIVLDEVLTDLGPERLQAVAEMRGQGIEPAQGRLGLQNIECAEHGQGGEHDRRQDPAGATGAQRQPERYKGHRDARGIRQVTGHRSPSGNSGRMPGPGVPCAHRPTRTS